MNNNRDCYHGRLARSCEICHLENEVKELENEVEKLKSLNRPNRDKNNMNYTDYTDDQLKAALAKMLPELLYIDYFEAKFISIRWLTNKPNYGRKGIPVLDTELLHLCWLIEKTLTNSEVTIYSDALEYAETRWWSPFNASWQQRVEALAEVKGIEL